MRPKHLGPNASMPSNVDLTGAFDPSTGLPYSVKKLRWPEIFEMRFDPEKIMMSPPLPVGVETVFKDVFPNETRGDKPILKIALHPWFKRWCLWEYVPASETDCGMIPEGWAFTQMFYKRGTMKPGYLPADLNYEDKRCEELRGEIGDYCPPDRDWLEWVKGHCSFEKMSPEKMAEFLILEQEDNKRNTESEHESRLHDFHSYYWNLFRDLTNIEEGCASKSMQCNQTSIDEVNQRVRDKMRTINHNGIKYVVRPGSRWEKRILDEIEGEKKAFWDHIDKVEAQKDRELMFKQAKRTSLGMQESGKTM